MDTRLKPGHLRSIDNEIEQDQRFFDGQAVIYNPILLKGNKIRRDQVVGQTTTPGRSANNRIFVHIPEGMGSRVYDADNMDGLDRSQGHKLDGRDDSQTPVAGGRAWSSHPGGAGQLRHSFDTGVKYNYHASTSCQMIEMNQGWDPYAALEATPGNTRRGRALRRAKVKLSASKKASITPAGRPGKDANMLLKKAKQRSPKLQQNGC